MKYIVCLTYRDRLDTLTKYIEVEARSEKNAKEIAVNRMYPRLVC